MKQPRTTFTEQEEREIRELEKDFRMKGKSDEEARKLAEDQFKKTDEMGDKIWNEFVKKIKLYDVIDDLLRRAFIDYKKEYNERQKKTGVEAPEIDFKLEVKRLKNPNGRNEIYGALIRFSIQFNGQWFTASEKSIAFEKGKPNPEYEWKMALYEAMFQGLIFNGITHTIMTHDARTQKVSGEVHTDSK